jgi:biotin carboxylase
MTTILILGAGRNQLPAIVAAKNMGLRVVTIDPAADAPGLFKADAFNICDLADREACLAFARSCHIDGVMTIAAEYPVPTLAYLCEQLDLRGIRPSHAEAATNKRKMREVFHACGVPSPISLHVTDVDNAIWAVAELGMKVVVKPTVSNGKKGITSLPKGASRNDVRQAFDRAVFYSRSDGALIEEYVDGNEFSVEAITAAGNTQIVAITEKFTSGDPYFVEFGHVQPARISRFAAEQLRSTAQSAINAIGITDSPTHTEIRLSSRGPKVIEIGARLGGGFIASHLTPLTTGVDIVGAAIRVALGISCDVSPRTNAAAAIWFLTASPGQVLAIDGLDKALASEGTVEAAVYVSVNDRVFRLTDNSCRVGHVICTAHDSTTAIARAETTARRISIVTEPA